MQGHVDVVRLLLDWGGDIALRPRGYSLLHLAAGVGQLASVRLLLELGADANGERLPVSMLPGSLQSLS